MSGHSVEHFISIISFDSHNESFEMGNVLFILQMLHLRGQTNDLSISGRVQLDSVGTQIHDFGHHTHRNKTRAEIIA